MTFWTIPETIILFTCSALCIPVRKRKRLWHIGGEPLLTVHRQSNRLAAHAYTSDTHQVQCAVLHLWECAFKMPTQNSSTDIALLF